MLVRSLSDTFSIFLIFIYLFTLLSLSFSVLCATTQIKQVTICDYLDRLVFTILSRTFAYLT